MPRVRRRRKAIRQVARRHGGDALVVSQFTLYGRRDSRAGVRDGSRRRPPRSPSRSATRSPLLWRLGVCGSRPAVSRPDMQVSLVKRRSGDAYARTSGACDEHGRAVYIEPDHGAEPRVLRLESSKQQLALSKVDRDALPSRAACTDQTARAGRRGAAYFGLEVAARAGATSGRDQRRRHWRLRAVRVDAICVRPHHRAAQLAPTRTRITRRLPGCGRSRSLWVPIVAYAARAGRPRNATKLVIEATVCANRRVFGGRRYGGGRHDEAREHALQLAGRRGKRAARRSRPRPPPRRHIKLDLERRLNTRAAGGGDDSRWRPVLVIAGAGSARPGFSPPP